MASKERDYPFQAAMCHLHVWLFKRRVALGYNSSEGCRADELPAKQCSEAATPAGGVTGLTESLWEVCAWWHDCNNAWGVTNN